MNGMLQKCNMSEKTEKSICSGSIQKIVKLHLIFTAIALEYAIWVVNFVPIPLKLNNPCYHTEALLSVCFFFVVVVVVRH